MVKFTTKLSFDIRLESKHPFPLRVPCNFLDRDPHFRPFLRVPCNFLDRDPHSHPPDRKTDARAYLFSIGLYLLSPPTFIYAGRMIRRSSKFSSSKRCAHQPTMRDIAKIGVYSSIGIPIIS